MNPIDHLYWIQRTARQHFNSAESDFERFHRTALVLEQAGRSYDARNAHSHAYFAAHALLRAAREMQAAGLPAGGNALQVAREYLSPQAEAERRKRLGL